MSYHPQPHHQQPRYPSPQNEREPWYFHNLFIFMSLFCCGPLGLILIWVGNKWTQNVRIIVTAIIGFFWAVGFLSMALVDPPETPRQAATSPSSAKAAKPIAQELEYVEESCRELVRKFGVHSELSEVQKEHIWKQYSGKAFKWNLEVTEVHSSLFGNYTVQFKCAPVSDSLIFDVQVTYSDQDFVVGLDKGKVYEIEAVLNRSGTLLGLQARGIP